MKTISIRLPYIYSYGEANNLRFMPECICFIYKCAFDYFESAELDTKANEFEFLDTVVTPIYSYIRNQQYELVNNVWKKSEKDHSDIIGYDDVNQFFWYRGNLEKIMLLDKSLLYEYPETKDIPSLNLSNGRNCFTKHTVNAELGSICSQILAECGSSMSPCFGTIHALILQQSTPRIMFNFSITNQLPKFNGRQ